MKLLILAIALATPTAVYVTAPPTQPTLPGTNCTYNDPNACGMH